MIFNRLIFTGLALFALGQCPERRPSRLQTEKGNVMSRSYREAVRQHSNCVAGECEEPIHFDPRSPVFFQGMLPDAEGEQLEDVEYRQAGLISSPRGPNVSFADILDGAVGRTTNYQGSGKETLLELRGPTNQVLPLSVLIGTGPGFAAPLPNQQLPRCAVEWGIDAASYEQTLDFWPGQRFNILASFLRISAIGPAAVVNPIPVSASIALLTSSTPELPTFTNVTGAIAAAGNYSQGVPAFARRVRVGRSLAAGGGSAPMRIEFLDVANNIVWAEDYTATDKSADIAVPGNIHASTFRLTNTGAAVINASVLWVLGF